MDLFVGVASIALDPDWAGRGPGDAVLGLILSKIVLLAADDRIADPVILSQLP